MSAPCGRRYPSHLLSYSTIFVFFCNYLILAFFRLYFQLDLDLFFLSVIVNVFSISLIVSQLASATWGLGLGPGSFFIWSDPWDDNTRRSALPSVDNENKARPETMDTEKAVEVGRSELCVYWNWKGPRRTMFTLVEQTNRPDCRNTFRSNEGGSAGTPDMHGALRSGAVFFREARRAVLEYSRRSSPRQVNSLRITSQRNFSRRRIHAFLKSNQQRHAAELQSPPAAKGFEAMSARMEWPPVKSACRAPGIAFRCLRISRFGISPLISCYCLNASASHWPHRSVLVSNRCLCVASLDTGCLKHTLVVRFQLMLSFFPCSNC